MGRRKQIIVDTSNMECPLTQEHVEWATGGPDGAHIKMGGSCMRPDIRCNSDHHCDGCDYFKYCLVTTKRLA